MLFDLHNRDFITLMYINKALQPWVQAGHQMLSVIKTLPKSKLKLIDIQALYFVVSG